ncbi:hypothetical protein CBS63078_11240 [Aspergillus niger]|nr:hypothetical protein CBS115989_9360 [Aspergillus niger]KAI2823738.1 hypothetical protein CBS133816_9027 [Aspergillus niger]KAI2843625.1 hypothetical protein CBS11350_5114 [Aspergillus niger]KAI2847841.1 hypothetical protein CBS11232_7037 [Aspergillus niger]KAI2854338.1 hypothetical protein CBS12448_7745 [Aspergillus niger]
MDRTAPSLQRGRRPTHMRPHFLYVSALNYHATVAAAHRAAALCFQQWFLATSIAVCSHDAADCPPSVLHGFDALVQVATPGGCSAIDNRTAATRKLSDFPALN